MLWRRAELAATDFALQISDHSVPIAAKAERTTLGSTARALLMDSSCRLDGVGLIARGCNRRSDIGLTPEGPRPRAPVSSGHGDCGRDQDGGSPRAHGPCPRRSQGGAGPSTALSDAVQPRSTADDGEVRGAASCYRRRL